MKQPLLLLRISEPFSLLSFPTHCFFQTICQWSIQGRYRFKQRFNLTQVPSLVCLEQHYRSAYSAWPDLTWRPLLPAPVHAHSSHVLLIWLLTQLLFTITTAVLEINSYSPKQREYFFIEILDDEFVNICFFLEELAWWWAQHVKWLSTHRGPFLKTVRHSFLYLHSNLVTLYKTCKSVKTLNVAFVELFVRRKRRRERGATGSRDARGKIQNMGQGQRVRRKCFLLVPGRPQQSNSCLHPSTLWNMSVIWMHGMLKESFISLLLSC